MHSIDEDARRRFESAWQAHRQARIEDFLPLVDAETYLPTLEELICIELEMTWKQCGKDGGGPLVEGYFERFPHLRESAGAAEPGHRERLLRLIRAEYEVRRDFGNAPDIDEYRRRFPQHIVTGHELTASDSPAAPPANFVQSLPAAGHVLVETLPSADRQSSRYTLSRVHAEGGLGRIWVAHDVNLNRDVALKEIKPETTSRPEVWQRFLKEAQIAGQLEHPNIVPVYELARRPDNDQPFYTMRLVRGETLRDRIHDYHERKRAGIAEALELPRLLTAFVSVCNAISFAHSKGVIHRDLKPDNVVLGAFGEVLVLDWGLAKLTAEKEESALTPVDLTASATANATKVGQVVGTPAYMSPEQAAGRISKMDARTDIYGLGAILFEILAGKPPHSGPDMSELISQIMLQPSPSARVVDAGIPRALNAICAKAMEREQIERYQTASALADDVQRYLADEPVSVYQAPLLDRAARFLRRHRTMALSGAAALLLVAIVASIAALLINEQRRLVTKAHGETKEALLREGESLKATERELLRANANRLASQSQEVLETQPQRALLMGVHAAQMLRDAKLEEQPLVRQALLDHLSRVGGRVLGPVKDGKDIPLEMDLVAIRPDGKLVAAASTWRRHARGADPSGSTTVFAWPLGEGSQQPLHLVGPKSELEALRFSDDGQFLAAASQDGHVYLWKTALPLAAEPVVVLPIPDPPPNLAAADVRRAPGAKNVAFSSDGLWLAAVYRAGQVRVWKMRNGLPEKVPWIAGFQIGSEQAPLDSARLPPAHFLPGNQRLLTAAPAKDEWQLHVWDLAKIADKPAASHPLGKQVRSFAFSQKGDQLAVGTTSGEARVYSLTAEGVPGQPLALSHQAGQYFSFNEVESLAFSPDGQWLVSSSVADVRLWNLNEATKSSPPRPHGIYPPGRRLTMDPQGAWFALGGDSISIGRGEGRGVALHDLPLLTADAQNSPFAMHVSGSLVWVQGKEGQREPRLLTTGPRAAETTPGITRLRGHQNFVVSLATDKLGHTLVSGGRDGMLRVWDTRQEDPFALPRRVPPQWGLQEGCLAPQGSGMLMASIPAGEKNEEVVRLWNLAQPQESPRYRILSGLDRRRTPFLGPSANDRWLIAAGAAGELLLWDLAKNDLPLAPLGIKLPAEHLFLPSGGAMRVSPDSRFVAAVVVKGNEQTIRTWDLSAADIGSTARTLAVRGEVERMAYSPDSKWLLVGTAAELKLHHLLAVEKTQEIPLEKDRASEIAFVSPAELAVGTSSGRIRFWSLADAKFTADVAEHHAPIISLMFAPEHKLAVSIAEGESPRLWGLRDGKLAESVILPLEDPPAGDIAVSPSGRWLVIAGGNDQPAVVWDLTSLDIPHSSVRLFRRWMPGDLVAGYVRFTPDSKQLITIGPTGARYWPLEMDDLVKLASDAAGRPLTASEKADLAFGRK